MSRVRIAAASLVLAAAAALSAAPASAKDVLVTQWDVAYEVTVTLDHHRAEAETSRDETLSYRVAGRLPEADFRGTTMRRGISADVKTTVDGKMSADTRHADGETYSCGGGPGQVNGFVTVQALGRSLLVAPFVGVHATCVGTRPDAVGVGPAAGSPSKVGDAVAVPTTKELEGDRWERPFELVLADDKCPVVDLSTTIGCTAKWTGKLVFTLRKRSSEPDNDDVLDDILGPVKTPKKPKLNPKRTEASVTVTCPKACTVEPDIGVFTQKNGKPYVMPVTRGRKQRLKAGKATTVRAPLSSKAQLVADQGAAGMRLTVTMAGRRYTQSFALG